MDGIIVINKPKGISSFTVIRILRKILKPSKIGYVGTLDPIASGVLPVCLGKSTKLSETLLNGRKVYHGEIELGKATNTYDAEGSIVEEREIPADLDIKKIKEVAKQFTGELLQTPPPFSATKHQGIPLYKLARKGIIINKQPKKIHVYKFDILDYNKPFIEIEVECSKGTYVRALANDLGRALGTCAHLKSLTRVASYPFHINQSHELSLIENKPVEEIQKLIIPHDEILNLLKQIN